MKARLPDPYKSCLEFDAESLRKSEKTMTHTWNEFRNALAQNKFEYSDTDSALKETFLKQFDKWFQGIGISELSVSLSEYLHDKLSGRGSVIRSNEPDEIPTYDRLLPKAQYINDDNRFSPPGIEWLYLSIGESLESIKKCAEKECRANPNDRFAFCCFKANPDFPKLKIVDLTIADNMSYDTINKRLQTIEKREYKKAFNYVHKHGLLAYKLNHKSDTIPQEIAKWTLHTYIKMMSKNLFVPIKTDNKKLEYSPFQALANYFIELGYDGIIFSSTVYPKAKNIVLFNKMYAIPYGEVLDYKVST